MFRLFVSEVLSKVQLAATDADKAKVLKDNSSIPLQHLLFANFNPNVKFLLPEGPTPYKPSKFDVGLGDNSLMKEFRKLYLFYQGGHKTLQQAKREQLWIQLLEGLSFSEAKVLESLKAKKFEKDYGVTRECVDLAFPRLLAKIPKAPKIVEPEVPAVIDSVKVDETPVAEEKPKKKRVKKNKKQEENKDEGTPGTTV